ncbi:cholesterol transport system auxiliary component [Sphingomonas jinjuensis]|uniref:Cholesterol transport system auxiliary component n=1 Tax=Sphingomonas jinjuensis TaxID=535907 RepID=A0A840F806_9SPHN|nr:ABC-type transport auxiliary lipoprotein family protein [Sphingomonas jinjuensis]MBB4152732.1 cholesterol transport system auxiliary component [Sphingomonas jinjuensis]
MKPLNATLVLVLAAAMPLAGCVSFGAKPPPSLLTLSSTAEVPVGQQQSSASAKTVTIAVPAVPQSLATTRVPVQATPTTIAYVKDAAWAEVPARLFARLLADTVTARTGRVVLSQAQSIADPGARLGGELRQFGLDAGARQAVVIYDASLMRADSQNVEKRRFEARVPVAAIDADAAGTGLSQAANQVAGQVADWVGR